MLVPFLMAVALSLVEFFSEAVAPRIEKYHKEILALNGGLMLGFLFLVIFPELFDTVAEIDNKAFFFLLLGFVVFHLAERFVYGHAHSHHERTRELNELHLIGVSAMGLIEGMALFFSVNLIGTRSGELIFLPLLLNAFNASIYMSHISRHVTKNRVWDAVLAMGPVAGFVIAVALSPAGPAAHVLFAFVAGALLYVVIRDILPSEEHRDPGLFTIGILLSILLSQMVGLLF